MKTYLQFLSEGVDGGIYTFRKLNAYSVEFLREWMHENGVPNPIPPGELHCTVVCSESAVSGYTPDPASVMLNPATYRVTMLNEALVIAFKSDPLEEQWQRAMNLGAKSRWPKFLPHISLSYQVPVDYDHTEVKPPPAFLVLNEEQIKPLVDGWASVNGLREGSEGIGQMGLGGGPGIYVPQNTMNVPREEMPQIASTNTMDFIDWLENQGIVVQFLDIPVALLRSVQDEIDLKRVEALTKKMPEALGKPLIISKDNYILDGHHRWLAILNKDPHYNVEVYRVNLPIKELLQTAQGYGKAFYRQSAVA